jgi:hypothetical protein
MPKNNLYEKILHEIEFLLESYSHEKRATVQPYHFANLSAAVKGYAYDPKDPIVRESLIEHVGSLPIVATALYPYIKDEEVDLGQALVMLAIHDIGELEIGDEISFTRTKDSHVTEREAALKLLHETYHKLYDDVESQKSKSAKFAKSIDKITPDILDYLTPPEMSNVRYKHFMNLEGTAIVDLIEEHKRPYMLWNPFLTEFHTLLLDNMRARFTDSKLK